MRRKWILNKPIKGVKLNPGHPLARGFVGLWLLNEGSGNKVFDLSGNGNNSSAMSNVVWVPGKSGSALEFNGTSSIITISDSSSLDITNEITIWIRFNADDLNKHAGDNTNSQVLLRKSGAYILYIYDITEAQNNLDFYLYGIATRLSLPISGNFVNDECYDVIATYDGSAMRIYVNGIEKTSTAISGAIGTSANVLAIGAQAGPSALFDGKIEFSGIYNRALSASEIQQLYKEPFCMFERQEIVFLAIAVGPANLLSVNAVTKANIKSINAVLIGSVKSINAIA